MRNLWRSLVGGGRNEPQMVAATTSEHARRAPGPTVEIAPNDPIIAYFQSAPGAVEIDKLTLDSPALRALKAAGVKLAVALVSQGELIGLLNLGPRLSEQDYSADDRSLLSNLATQAGPAVRVAQLVRQQQIEAQSRERLGSVRPLRVQKAAGLVPPESLEQPADGLHCRGRAWRGG